MFLKSDTADFWNLKGLILSKMGLFNESLEAFSNSLKIEPNNGNTLYNFAYLYLLMDKKDKALNTLSRAISIDESLKNNAKNDLDLKDLWNDDSFQKIIS